MTDRFLPCLLLSLAAAATLAPAATAQDVADRTGTFMQSERRTASADVAIDAAGGMHMAFVHREPDVEGAAAVYAYCDGSALACSDFAEWTTVELSGATRDVQVDVTPDGHPRLLITANSTVQPGGIGYVSAECDAECGTAGGWQTGTVATSWDNSIGPFLSDRLPQRTFLVDPNGRPQFLYSDRNYQIEPDHYGTFWMTCKDGCTDRANWTETDIARHSDYDTEIFDEPALAVDAEGRPRVAGRIFALTEDGQDDRDGVYYLACDSGCRDRANWRRTWLVDAGGGSYPAPTWDLEVDPQGRPRVAFFAGDGMENPELSHSLLYAYCDAADCMHEDAWSGSMVVSEGHGEMASLELDDHGRPRLAFRTAGGDLAYAWCDEACQTPEAPWNVTMLESQAEQTEARPVALPFTCDGEVWESLAPELTLAPGGRPVVAYDVSVEGRCLYEDPSQPAEVFYDFNELWRGARIVSFTPVLAR